MLNLASFFYPKFFILPILTPKVHSSVYYLFARPKYPLIKKGQRRFLSRMHGDGRGEGDWSRRAMQTWRLPIPVAMRESTGSGAAMGRQARRRVGGSDDRRRVGRRGVQRQVGGGATSGCRLVWSGACRKKIRGAICGQMKRNKWVLQKGHKSLFIFIFNTVSAQNELKCHFGEKTKLMCQNRKKKVCRVKKGSQF
jgi:hypothetical protein